MNGFDLAFALIALSAAIGGWRLGLVRRVIGWVGLIFGIFVASRLLPVLLTTPSPPQPIDLVKSLGVLLLGGTLGQGIGLFAGRRVKRLVDDGPISIADDVAGAIVGVLGVVVGAWMVVPAMVQIPGWPNEVARSSAVATRLTRTLGPPPDLLAGVSDSLGVPGLSDALQGVRDLQIEPSAPAESSVPPEFAERVRASVVRLSGPACHRRQSGSGFVVAPGVVATNAHVVAGAESLTISDDGGLDVDGEVVYLDVRNDVALVRAPDLDRPVLPLVEGAEGSDGAVFGYPGGGPLVVQPYRIAADSTVTSKDIYDNGRFSRRILIIGSRIGPGDSGGPLVAPDGAVAGMVFGIAPDDDQTAYAIPAPLVADALDRISPVPVSSGPCRLGA